MSTSAEDFNLQICIIIIIIYLYITYMHHSQENLKMRTSVDHYYIIHSKLAIRCAPYEQVQQKQKIWFTNNNMRPFLSSFFFLQKKLEIRSSLDRQVQQQQDNKNQEKVMIQKQAEVFKKQVSLSLSLSLYRSLSLSLYEPK